MAHIGRAAGVGVCWQLGRQIVARQTEKAGIQQGCLRMPRLSDPACVSDIVRSQSKTMI